MFNIGGPEVLVILLLALIVLGPQRLPDAAKQVAKVVGELRRVSSGFQNELKAAMDDPVEAVARERGAKAAAAPARPDVEAVPASVGSSSVAAKASKATNGTKPAKKATAAKAAARKRSAPLQAARPGRSTTP